MATLISFPDKLPPVDHDEMMRAADAKLRAAGAHAESGTAESRARLVEAHRRLSMARHRGHRGLVDKDVAAFERLVRLNEEDPA